MSLFHVPGPILSSLGCFHLGPSRPQIPGPSQLAGKSRKPAVEGKAAGEALSGYETGDGAEQGEGEAQRQGEAQGKPAVTALALISQLQSRPAREPACVCALLTQAGKTFLS